jgi:hypothetical protein
MACLLPYWSWSGSERNIDTSRGRHCFAETCRRRLKKRKIKKYRIQWILLVILYIFENARSKNQNYFYTLDPWNMLCFHRCICSNIANDSGTVRSESRCALIKRVWSDVHDVCTGLNPLNVIRKHLNTFCGFAFGKPLCTYKRCWKWCPRTSIQALFIYVP